MGSTYATPECVDGRPARDSASAYSGSGVGGGSASSCLHVVVVDVLEDTPIQYKVEIDSPKTVAEAMQRRSGSEAGVTTVNATRRLFDAGYNASLGFVGDKIVLDDFLGPGDVAVFEIGCEGPKPTMGCGRRLRAVCEPAGAVLGPLRPVHGRVMGTIN